MAEVRITVFELEVYWHGLPEEYTEPKPLKVYFDNVVGATQQMAASALNRQEEMRLMGGAFDPW